MEAYYFFFMVPCKPLQVKYKSATSFSYIYWYFLVFFLYYLGTVLIGYCK